MVLEGQKGILLNFKIVLNLKHLRYMHVLLLIFDLHLFFINFCKFSEFGSEEHYAIFSYSGFIDFLISDFNAL